MELTIYADVLFATNFLMDLGILFLTMQLSRMKWKLFRLTLASGLLALYGTVSFMPELSGILSGVGRFLMGMIAVWILSPPGGWRGFLKARAIFSLVSAGMGGVVYAMVAGTNLGRQLGTVLVNGAFYFLLDIRLLLAGIFLSYGLIFWFRQICIRNFSREKVLVPMELTIGEEKITVTALADTGCELTMPITGTGVMLISEKILQGITPKDSFWLPIHTAGGDDRIPAFYPEEAVSLSQRYDLLETPVIGIVKGRLSRDGLYSGILNPVILNEKNQMGGRDYEKEITMVATVLFQNVAKMVSHSTKGSLLYRRQRNATLTTCAGRGRSAADEIGCSRRTGAGAKNAHRKESSVGGLHSSEV